MSIGRSHAMRPALAILALLGGLCPALCSNAPADVVEVQLDKAKILRMPEHASTIVVGNPIIADVTTLKGNGLVIVTGKGFGETNLIFLDSAGTAVEETGIRVTGITSMVTVQRGMDRESYSCQPRCQPVVTLGDADSFMKGASAQITSRNALALPVSH